MRLLEHMARVAQPSRTNSIDESSVLIELQDNGAGIAVETIESIFDPFVTTKPEGD